MNYISISTERLRLQPIQESDIDEIYATLSAHPELCHFLTFDPPNSRKDTAEFVLHTLSQMPEKEVVWAVRLHDGTFVGLIGLHNIKRKVLAWQIDGAELGYWLAPEFQGKGFGAEMVEAVIAEGFARLKLHKISARYVLGNTRSTKLLKKLGFQEVGIQRQHFYRYDKWWDCGWMELLNKNFIQ